MNNLDHDRPTQALAFVERGVPITLCAGESGKVPVGSDWGNKRYDEASIKSAFSANPTLNIGIILGPASGIIDIECDDPESEGDLRELFEGEVPRTPTYSSRRGKHRLFKYNDRFDELGAVKKWKTVELRLGGGGRAAQSLVPPSKAEGVLREWEISPIECDFAEVPEIVIHKLCPPKEPKQVVHGEKGRPGDDFDRRGPSVESLLVESGWTRAGDDGKDVLYMCRPGKTTGTSATIGFCKTDEGLDMLHVFSTNAEPFKADCTYSKFAVYTLLNHDGDYSAAAAELATEGFGESKARGKNTEATKVVDSLLETYEVNLFHTPEGETCASVLLDGHRENFRTSSSQMKMLMNYSYYQRHGRVQNSTTLSDAINALESIALFEGPERPVYLRVALHNGDFYVDRGSSNWDAVKISSSGYESVEIPPVNFLRSNGMLELPLPESGNGVDELRSLFNVSADQFPLLVASLLSYLRPTGPYPCTFITGEAGTAKSTSAKQMRALFDPNDCLLRSQPNNIQSLMVTARNNWGVVIDNITKIPNSLSDALCVLATGGGFATRQLYTDGEEFVIDVQRPVIITGIGDIMTQSDLIDRSIRLELDPIEAADRRPDLELEKEFESKRPVILGTLLAALSWALRHYQDVTLQELPRMADFAKWSTAAEGAFDWERGTFMKSFTGNQTDSMSVLLDSKLAQEVTKLVDRVIRWEGTPSSLYRKLSDDLERSPGDEWPDNPSAMGRELTRLAPVLRTAGYDCLSSRTGGRRRWTLIKDCAALGA